jgi:hypothetical protein
MRTPSLFRQPSAFLPILISITALVMVLAYVALHGASSPVRHDEGTPARVFQILMISQIPMVLLFAIKWLPRDPKQALLVLGFQGVAWWVPVAAIMYFEK